MYKIYYVCGDKIKSKEVKSHKVSERYGTFCCILEGGGSCIFYNDLNPSTSYEETQKKWIKMLEHKALNLRNQALEVEDFIKTINHTKQHEPEKLSRPDA